MKKTSFEKDCNLKILYKYIAIVYTFSHLPTAPEIISCAPKLEPVSQRFFVGLCRTSSLARNTLCNKSLSDSDHWWISQIRIIHRYRIRFGNIYKTASHAPAKISRINISTKIRYFLSRHLWKCEVKFHRLEEEKGCIQFPKMGFLIHRVS